MKKLLAQFFIATLILVAIEGYAADKEQLPHPILQHDAEVLDMLYPAAPGKPAGVPIYKDPDLKSVSTGKPVSGLYDPAKKEIWVNSSRCNPNTGTVDLGYNLKHEMTHAKLDGFQKLTGVNYKIPSSARITIHELNADQAANDYQKTLGGQFKTEAKIANEIGMKYYDPFAGYKNANIQAFDKIPTSTYQRQTGSTISSAGQTSLTPYNLSAPAAKISTFQQNVTPLAPIKITTPTINNITTSNYSNSQYSMPKISNYSYNQPTYKPPTYSNYNYNSYNYSSQSFKTPSYNYTPPATFKVPTYTPPPSFNFDRRK